LSRKNDWYKFDEKTEKNILKFRQEWILKENGKTDSINKNKNAGK